MGEVEVPTADTKSYSIKQNETIGTNGSRILTFMDPDGNTLQLTEINWRKYFKAIAPK